MMVAKSAAKPNSTARVFAGLLALFFFVTFAPVHAELLPVKTYTRADGLLRDEVYRIKQDSRGFLWFCTGDGLSRFDGYGFTNYTTDDGLPHRLVTDFLETRSGVYWVGTSDGLARFNPRGKRGLSIRNSQSAIRNSDEAMFVVFRVAENKNNSVTVLFEDARGVLWCGTDDGLYWFEEGDGKGIFHPVEFPKEMPGVASGVSAIIQDQRGSIWIGMIYDQGLNRILPDGRREHYVTGRPGGQRKNESITSLLETTDGQIWVGLSLDGGLCSLAAEPAAQGPIFSRCYNKKDGLAANWIQSLYQTTDGKLWVGTVAGITVNPKSANVSSAFITYKEAQGLCDRNGEAVLEDRDGNIWVATSCGVKRITRSGFVRYTQADGLASLGVNGIFTSHTGDLFVVTKQSVETRDQKPHEAHRLNRFDRNKFTAVEPSLPQGVNPGWGGGQIIVQDKTGDWWLPSGNYAVYRFRKTSNLRQLANAKPQAISIPDATVFRIYEDSHGDVWISTMYDAHLLKWERASETMHDFKVQISSGNITRYGSCFAEDKSGALWIGSEYDASLIRYKDERIDVIPTNRQRPDDGTNTLYFDHLGRLWLATKLNGVGRIDNPNADLKIVWYNRKVGLATDSARGLVEDQFGRIYVGSGRGVDRIDPNSGQIKHYTSADGLPQGGAIFSARGAEGALWFGYQGLARLVPEQDKPRQSPNILLTGLRVAGVAQSVSELGEASLSQLHLDSNQTQVSISFVGLGASLGEELRYQYKLEGANSDWIETTQRSVDFASLAPGSYRFAVRAITFDGITSQTPASVSFTIPAPIWKRWWFVSLAVLVIGGLAFVGYRYRVNRLLEIERVRTRIATDLHDDIGSNLSKISILSEVARQQYEPDGYAGVPPASSPDSQSLGNSTTPLSSIANISRESVASMSDIVWAINPQKDSLLDLVRRMRRFAEDTLESRNIVADFRAPDATPALRLGADIRRQIYLIFKECINNIVRHSEATQATIDLQIEAKELVLTISDNGKGFDAGLDYEGNGLAGMKRRAGEFGGKLTIDSADGKGARVEVAVRI